MDAFGAHGCPKGTLWETFWRPFCDFLAIWRHSDFGIPSDGFVTLEGSRGCKSLYFLALFPGPLPEGSPRSSMMHFNGFLCPFGVPLGSIGTPMASPGEGNKGTFLGNRSGEGFGRVQGTILELFLIVFGDYFEGFSRAYVALFSIIVESVSAVLG